MTKIIFIVLFSVLDLALVADIIIRLCVSNGISRHIDDTYSVVTSEINSVANHINKIQEKINGFEESKSLLEDSCNLYEENIEVLDERLRNIERTVVVMALDSMMCDMCHKDTEEDKENDMAKCSSKKKKSGNKKGNS